jgi:hypothetical protein
MRERERALEKLARSMVLAADQQSDTKLNTVTVEGQRQTLKRQVSAFVSATAVAPYTETLARWENPRPGTTRRDRDFCGERTRALSTPSYTARSDRIS